MAAGHGVSQQLGPQESCGSVLPVASVFGLPVMGIISPLVRLIYNMVGLIGEQDRCTALFGAGDERELAFDLALTVTTGVISLMIPGLSPAIFSSVSPRNCA